MAKWEYLYVEAHRDQVMMINGKSAAPTEAGIGELLADLRAKAELE